MSKYTEYRAIAEKMKTFYQIDIGDSVRKVSIRLDPIKDLLGIEIDGCFHQHELKNIEGEEGEALFLALKQIYE
jgi:DNA-binding cell septation regulator SpoVG